MYSYVWELLAALHNLRLRSYQGSAPEEKSDGSTGDSGGGCETSETLEFTVE